jgi:hypothetical protein
MAVVDTLRLLWLNGLVNATGVRSLGTEKFLSPKIVTVNAVLPDNSIKVYVANAAKSAEYFSHEADRFATACFESVLSETSTKTLPRSTGWLIIRNYYSAFFAVHSLLRLRGWACSRILKENINSLNQELRSIAPQAKALSAGLYLMRCDGNPVDVIIGETDSRIGGSHEVLWSLLTPYLDEILSLAQAESFDNSSDADFCLAIEHLKKQIKRNGGDAWFTRIRNRVNYSHEYGAWFPYLKSTTDFERLQTISNYWRLSPEKIPLREQKEEITEFICCCAFLISLCRINIEDLRYRGKANSPFRKSSGLLLLNNLSAR